MECHFLVLCASIYWNLFHRCLKSNIHYFHTSFLIFLLTVFQSPFFTNRSERSLCVRTSFPFLKFRLVMRLITPPLSFSSSFSELSPYQALSRVPYSYIW